MGSLFEEYRQTVKASGGGQEPEGSAIAGPKGQMSSFQQYRAEHGVSPDQRVDLLGTYKQWYTGRNLDGPGNGWDTRFMETAQSQYVKALESGDPNEVLNRFQAKDAAGVVTWDGARGANGERFVFGDVISDGKKVGNVYDDMDRHTANVMMGEWTISDGAKKARLNNAGDYEKAWDEEIQRIRTESTSQAETAPRAYQMEKDTRERAKDEEVLGIVAAGIGGGAALGTAGGAIFGGVGAVPGAIIGGIAGGIGAWLNQDALSYQVAREREKLDMIREQGGSGWAYAGEWLSSASMTAYSTALSPVSNLVQGGYDVYKDVDFDASTGGAFYDTNDEGQRTAPGAIQLLDLAAKIGDSALTFGSGLARSVYYAQMATGIGGRVMGLAPGAGQWDPQKMELDSVWTNAEGDFDLGSAAAGVGYVGIEAVQLGGAKGLFSRLQRNAGKQTSQGATTVFERLNLSKKQRQTLKEGGRLEQQAGWKFVTDEQGRLVGKGKATVAMLAPSEALQSLAAKAMARRAAAREAGAVEAEVLYQKAFNLASGEKKFQTALVNAFGEAQEEGLQTVLEPLKHEGSIDPEEVFRAAAGGFAAGLGMGVAAARTRPGQDQRFFEQARMAHFINTGGDTLQKEDWDQMTELQKRQLVRSSVMADSVIKGGWEKLEQDMIAAEQGDVVASDRVRDWYKTRVTAILNAGSQKATDASLTIVMLDSARFRPDALATSHGQLIKDQKARSVGIETQIDNMTAEREKVTDAGRLAEIDEQLGQMAQMLQESNKLLENFRAIGRKIDAAIEKGDTARVYRLVDRLNDGIQQVYDMDAVPGLDDAALMVRAKAISRIATRHPEDSTASFQSFVPQVDPFFAEFKADGVAAVSQLTNKGMRSDFDGDKVHALQQLMLDDKEYADLRSGVNILGASVTPEIGTTPAEEWVLDEVRVAGSSHNDVVRALVDKLVKEIRDSLYDFYVDTGYIDRTVIDRVMEKVEDTVRSGGDVRNVLLTEMSREAGSTLMEIGRGVKPHMGTLRFSNQFFVLAQMATEHIQEFQAAYAEHRPRYGNPTTVASSAGAHSTESRKRRQAKAGTVAGTIAEVEPGDNLFRMFQKLHYQLMNSTEMYVGWSGDNPDYQELAQFFEQISSGATGLKAEEQTAGDAIVGSVLSQLERLAKDERTLKSIDPGLTTMNNVALLANMQTAQYVYAENPVTNRMEKQFTGKRVTLAQQLLYETLMKFRNNPANSRVWDTDPSMATTFTTLMKLTRPSESGSDETLANEERAFLEIFEAVPLYDMVGQDSKALGVTLTVGQYYRRIKDMHPDLRRLEKGGLDVYLARDAGAPGAVTPPLSLESIDKGEVTTMRTLVDSVFSAARSEISVTKSGKTKGKVTGHMAQRNGEIRKEIHQTWAQVRAVMQKVMPKTEYTAADVRQFIVENPDIGRLIHKVIPDSIMPVVYKGTDENGQARFASWFYDVWAQPTAEAAEMRLRWRIWMDEWQAHVDGLNLDDDTPDEVKGVHYDRLTSRFHRLMYHLATMDQGDHSFYQDLLLRGANSTSLEDFENWLNNVSGHLGGSAPLLGWVDDTAEFDATKTGSGWSQVRSTPQLREDLAALRSAAGRKVGQVDDDKRQWQADQVYVRSIKRGFMEATGQLKPSEVKDIDRQRYQQFLAVIEQAKKRDLSYGPRAMVLNVAIGAYGIYGNATTKGAHPEHLNAVESLEAVLNAFGYTVNLERVLGDVTAHNEDAVAASPELVVKQGGRLTNSNGQQVQWSEQTAETLIPLMEDQKSLELVMSILQPQVMELGFDNRPRRQMLTKAQSVKSLLTSTESSNLYNDDTRPGLAQSMKYLSQLEARSRGKTPFAVQQRVTEMVLAKAAALPRQATITEMEQLTIQAYMDLAAVLQEAGQVPATAAGDPLVEMWEDLKKELRAQASQTVFGVDRSSLMSDQDLETFLKQQLTGKYEEQIRALRTEAATTTGSMQAQLLKMADDLQARWDRDLERLEDMLNRDIVGQTVRAYGYVAGEGAGTPSAPQARPPLVRAFERAAAEPFQPGKVQFHGDKWDTRPSGLPLMLDEMERLGLPRDEALADELREYIRGGGSLGLGTEAVVDKFPRLTELARQGPRFDTLYRTQADWLGDTEVGDVINESGRLLSWSTDEAASRTFNAGANQIEVRGANGLPLGSFTPHKEVLTRGSFRVVEIDKSDPYNIKAVVEHIPEAAPAQQAAGGMSDVEKAERQTVLAQFVADHLDLMEGAGESLPLVRKILRALYSSPPTDPDLTDEQWETLSKRIISMQIQNQVTVGSPTSVPPPFPGDAKEGRLDTRRYWDYTFSFLADFLDPNATDGLLEAARADAVAAGRVATGKDSNDVLRTLLDTIYHPDNIGEWTPAIPIQGIEQNELLTGASSVASISMAGLLTQRWAAVSAATKRTNKVPPPELDTTVELVWSDLDWEDSKDESKKRNLYDHTVPLILPGDKLRERPLIEVHKRFARSAVFTYPDPADPTQRVTVDLMSNAKVATQFTGDVGLSADSGLREININRMREEIRRIVSEAGADLDEVEVNIAFLHPEAQPATEDYYNNLWFEGTIFDSVGDVSDSLLYSLWFGADGINARVQQAALDTRKKGTFGVEAYTKPDLSDVARLENAAEQDFAAMLAGKARIIMLTDLGDKAYLEPEFYNGIHKLLKLKHFVDGTVDGKRRRFSAEEIIANQLKFGEGYWDENGNQLRDAELWIASDQVLAEMMGEQGFGGVPGRFLRERLTTAVGDTPAYRGWSDRMGQLFPVEQSKGTLQGSLVGRTLRVTEPLSSLELDPAQQNLFKKRQEAFRTRQAAVRNERQSDEWHGFDPRRNLDYARDQAERFFSAEDVTLNLPKGIQWASLPPAEVAMENTGVLQQYISAQTGQTGGMVSGWVYQHEGAFNLNRGQLTKADLGGRVKMMPGDLVILDVSSFANLSPADARKEMADVISYLASQQVAVVPVASGGPNSLTAEARHQLLNDFRYQRYGDSPRVLVPDVMVGRRFANAASHRSSLTTVEDVTVRRQRIMGLLRDRDVDANTMLVPTSRPSKFSTYQLVGNILPVNVSDRFGVPRGDDLDKVRRTLEGLNTAAGISFLQKLGKVDANGNYEQEVIEGKKDDKSFAVAWQRLMDRIDASIAEGTTLPAIGTEDWGTGDLVPLLSDTGELLLYRHGYKFPYANLEAQLAQNLNGETGPRRVAVYGAPDPAATTHKGTVANHKNRRRHGIQLELEVSADVLGSKQIFEVDGMKWLAAPLGKQFEEPDAPILGDDPNALWMDGYGSLHDVLSKQATYGLVNGFRNALAFFGNDFLQDAADFLNVTPDQARQILKAVERSGNKLSIDEVVELSSIMNGGISAQTAAIARLISDLTGQGIDTEWIGRLTEDSAGAYITRSMVLYLMSEGAQLKDIQYSSGLWLQQHTEPNAVSRRMPRLFTNMLDAAPIGSPVRTEMFRRFNDKLGSNGNQGWTLDQAWNLIGTRADGTEIEMDLAFGEAHISDDNPELNVQAQDRKRRQGTSMHAARVTEFGVGGEVFPDPKKLAQIDQVLDKKPDTRLESGELWKSMVKVNKATFGPGSQWQRDTPMEQRYRDLAIARYVAYRTAIDWEQESLQDDRPALMSKRSDVVRAFGLHENQAVLVDYWIRQMLWRPGIMPGQINYDDTFSPKDLFQVMDDMISNAQNGHFPTYNASGPQMISEADLRVLFNAAQRGGWRPFTIEGDPNSGASLDRYGDWVYTAFGQALNSDVEIDDAYLLDLDGHMNTYREFLKAQGHMLEVSLDKELVAKFLDPDTNELIAVSASPIQAQQLMEQVILPRVNLGFEGLQSGVGVAETQTGLDAQASWKSHSRRRVVEFRRKNKIRPTETTSARHYVEYGSKVVQSNAELHSLSRILLALRHGTTMLNPGLYVSMVPEQGFRIFLNGMANLLSGESTSRSVGGLTSRLSFTEFTPEQVEKLNLLYENLANNNAFAGMIIKDLMWQPPGADAPGGKIVRAVEKFAAVGNKWQDPTWGLPQKVLARMYVEAIMRSIQAMPVENVMTIESVIAHLQTDPAYFQKKHPELHQMASNAVVDLRGLRNTPLSLAAKALYEPLTRSSSATVNFAGTLIKLPLMYATFAGNMLTTLTGMQGYSQILATFLDGRQTPGTLMHRMAKAAKGEKLTKEDDVRYDMSSTFDGYTIANAFIRGGVTQTGLFMLGMLTGGVLSGDDEESRRRRRLARAMGVPQIADPRRMEADFRNKDLVFLDWLPPQLQAMFNIAEENEAQDVRAGVQMSWLMKPFLSPIIGMERFFQTGDFGWITYGFMDGVGSLPLFNKGMWDDTVRAAEELQALAAEQQELSTPDATRNTMWLLTSALGLYENMLLENMFINSIYAGMDTWDRDPTKTQLLDSDGTIQRTIDNTARPNDLALEDYVDDEGNVQRAFVNRNDRDRAFAYFSENRGTAAFILSVATGFQKGLSRYSMPVKMREIELPETGERQTMEFALTALNSAWQAQGGPPKAMTLEEITKHVAGDAASRGDWDTYNNVDAIAAALYAETPQWDAMSVLGPDGEEEMTRDGIDAVIKGLQKGTIDLESPAIKQIAIDRDTRKQIQADFLADVTQQGVDIGLTNTQAVDRAERLFYGPFDDPSVVGFADILWSDRIPYSNKRKYKQLNTTYVPGPDGFPWATGFGRTGPGQQIGLPKKPVLGFSGATTMDGRMNTVDLALGINTGLRGLVPFDETENIPTDVEIGKAIEEAIADIESKTNDFEPFDNSNSSGRYYKRGGLYRRYGSYGGGGSSYGGGLPRIYFSKMPYMANGRNVYGDSTRNIFWDNAQIRRTRIRRERYQSQRGRLNQWQ